MSNQFQNQPSGNSFAVEPPQRAVASAPAVATAAKAEPNLDFITTDNREAEYQAALKHSKKVKFWKFAFPVFGVIVLCVLIGALVLRSLETGGVTIGNIDVNDGNLVMEAPELNGFDKNKRPYNLSASQAIQDLENPTRVELLDILAELPMDNEITATIQAGNGIYDADAKTLVLKDNINLVTSNGMTVTLQDADVDIGNSTMRTNNPISATSSQADISSETMRVEEGGNKMIFEGKVRMTLRPDTLQDASETNEQN